MKRPFTITTPLTGKRAIPGYVTMGSTKLTGWDQYNLPFDSAPAHATAGDSVKPVSSSGPPMWEIFNRKLTREEQARLELFKSGIIADVSLRIDGKPQEYDVRAHRAILGPASDVFRAKFVEQQHRYDSNVVIIFPRETSIEALRAMARFCYCGDYQIMPVPGAVALAKRIEENTQLHLEVFDLANSYGIGPLCQFAADGIVGEFKHYRAFRSNAILNIINDLLEHAESVIRKAGLDLLDEYLRRKAVDNSNSEDFAAEVLGNPGLTKLVLTGLYWKALAQHAQKMSPAVGGAEAPSAH
ncbi:hypothetical protein P171DRAFT_490649 [Karstenula rhodostoma CBS 690.94]|uniref:BTB domain-containing protein n=1 Tax=Karstenula rhodostoma CBS 690.94 TaxID=1392251 RepID=A0A9P4P8A2_9PLEO|nr:hypothetical protein P171DRAFT_490649 [Karstenula rhodostoma CBS 690.94]